MKQPMRDLRLIGRLPLSERVSHFVFQAPFAHEAGQYVALSAQISGATAKRYYSIASPPRPDHQIHLCIDHEGAFGSHLRRLRPGDTVACSAPAGAMRLLDPSRAAVYFAAGTGIAPLRAILLAQLTANPNAQATLVLAARYSRDLLYREEFEELAGRHGGFRFLPTVSGDDADWRGRRGRATAHVDEALAGRSGLDAYFCGQRELVHDLQERLREAGIPDERQSFERY